MILKEQAIAIIVIIKPLKKFNSQFLMFSLCSDNTMNKSMKQERLK